MSQLAWRSLCIDCTDPRSLANWWAELLGGEVTAADDDEVAVQVSPALPQLLFLAVPEPKDHKARLHLDLRPVDQSAQVARAEAMGARRVDVGQGDVSWVVLADPDGNEFCILSSLGT